MQRRLFDNLIQFLYPVKTGRARVNMAFIMGLCGDSLKFT